MTTEAACFQPRSRTRRRALAGFGLAGNIALMGLVVICLPVGAVFAVAVGSFSVVVDILGRGRRHVAALAHAQRGRSGRPLDLDRFVRALHQRLVESGAKPALWISRLEDRVVISLPGARSFLPDQAQLSPQGRTIARAIGDLLNGGNRVDVIGYGGGRIRNAPDGEPLCRGRASAVADALRLAGCAGPIAVYRAEEADGDEDVPVVTSGVDVVVRASEQVGKRAA